VNIIITWPYTGLAAASTEQRAFNDVWMPACQERRVEIGIKGSSHAACIK
jgi:hypothetical protein